MGVNLRATLARQSSGLAMLFHPTNLRPGDVLFIDEIHRLNRIVEEVLYPAMEDFAVDIIIGRPAARSDAHQPPEVHIGWRHDQAGTTDGPHCETGSVPVMRPRFLRSGGNRTDHCPVRRDSWRALNADGGRAIALRSRGTPRIANRLLKRVRDVAEVRGAPLIDAEIAAIALEMLDVDEFYSMRSIGESCIPSSTSSKEDPSASTRSRRQRGGSRYDHGCL